MEATPWNSIFDFETLFSDFQEWLNGSGLRPTPTSTTVQEAGRELIRVFWKMLSRRNWKLGSSSCQHFPICLPLNRTWITTENERALLVTNFQTESMKRCGAAPNDAEGKKRQDHNKHSKSFKRIRFASWFAIRCFVFVGSWSDVSQVLMVKKVKYISLSSVCAQINYALSTCVGTRMVCAGERENADVSKLVRNTMYSSVRHTCFKVTAFPQTHGSSAYCRSTPHTLPPVYKQTCTFTNIYPHKHTHTPTHAYLYSLSSECGRTEEA